MWFSSRTKEKKAQLKYVEFHHLFFIFARFSYMCVLLSAQYMNKRPPQSTWKSLTQYLHQYLTDKSNFFKSEHFLILYWTHVDYHDDDELYHVCINNCFSWSEYEYCNVMLCCRFFGDKDMNIDKWEDNEIFSHNYLVKGKYSRKK